MVFERRFTAASPRYLGFNALSKTDNHGPCPSPNTYARLTRPFLMVLGSGPACSPNFTPLAGVMQAGFG